MTIMPDELAVEESDTQFAAWMRDNLDHAARQLGLRVTGLPKFGWRLRTVGAAATGADGLYWLRVVSEYPEWAHGETWTGNNDAEAVDGLPRPRVLDVLEWEDGRVQRAEMMTLLPGWSVSATDVLHEAPDLPDDWWVALRAGLDKLHAVPTERTNTDQGFISARATTMLARDVQVEQWETVHGDVHWSNLMRAPFGLVDWELWGRGPVGTDAATLLLYSLLVPELAERVYDTFADVLDTETGRRAQLVVAARLLSRIAGGDYPELAGPLNRHLRGLGVGLDG